jgi:hypothetical protein
MRNVVWFSCGAASAVAAKIAVNTLPDVVVAYCDTSSTEHPDNLRFLADVERWIGQPVLRLKSGKYDDIWDVFEKTRYLVGVAGARCTSELKRAVRVKFEREDDVQIFGYTIDEQHRSKRFNEQNPEINTRWLLIEHGLTKEDCLGMLWKAGIEIPTMYKMGYENNNCIGCVKGQAGYWNKIRKDFPDVFDRMAGVERELNAAINKHYVDGERIRIFLDELPEDMGNYKDEPNISCGIVCMSAYEGLDIEVCEI